MIKPMLRGVAARTLGMLVLSTLTQAGMLIGLALWPSYGAWWLAAFGAAGLILGSRLRSLIEADLTPLHAACLPLPLAPRWLGHMREVLALSPILTGLALLTGLAIPFHGIFKIPALVAYLCAVFIFNLLQLRLARRTPPIKASTWAALWLTMLVGLVALASETVR
jgi:hypothetical protein